MFLHSEFLFGSLCSSYLEHSYALLLYFPFGFLVVVATSLNVFSLLSWEEVVLKVGKVSLKNKHDIAVYFY